MDLEPKIEEEDHDLLEVMPSPAAPPPPPVAPIGRVRSKTCDVRGCTSNSLRNPELLFVAVPGHNAPERRFVWLTLMQAVRDKKRSYVCSRHFAVPEDFKDFQEYISAPPGYKRQLLVKRGVVPHFNMPPLNMPGLPPLNDRWQLTLPVGMTEADRLRQARVTAMFGGGDGHVQGLGEMSAAGNRPNKQQNATAAVKKSAKAVQTETVFSSGQRKAQPSLQYCRLCLQRQDLEPIFTGDQTLIEPDLIDKIYGCTQILITVENDFPSSICTNCYQNVQHFITFRRSVQKNDQSLRSTAAIVGTFKPAPCPVLPTPTPTPTTSNAVPAQPLVRTKTVGKVTPMRPVPSAQPVRASLASPVCPGIVPLAPWSKPRPQQQPVQQQQKQPQPQPQRRFEAYRSYELQRTTIRKLPLGQSPSRDTSGNPADIDPFANVEESSSAAWNNQQDGVQMGDRVVPVTLIRVQPEEAEEEEEYEYEEPEVQPVAPQEDNSRRNFLQPKPLEQLVENARKAAPETEPEVLQAVQLIPSAVAKEVAKQRSAPKIFLRKFPVPSKRLGPVPTLSKVKEPPKISMVPKIVRAVKFPGTLTTLFSAARKPAKPGLKPKKSIVSPELVKYKPVESSKPAENPKQAPEMAPKPAPSSKPKITTAAAQVLKEVKVPEEPRTESPRPKPKLIPTTKPKQKENDIPETTTVTDVSSPRTARARKIPAKFQDTIGFPMPKVVIKPDPDALSKEASPQLPVVRSASELPELRVRVQDARARLSGGKPDVSPAPKTRLSSGKVSSPVVPKEPERKTQASKVKEVEKKPATPVTKPKESQRNVSATKLKEVEKKPTTPVSKPKELTKNVSATKVKEMEKKPTTPVAKPKESTKIVPKFKEVEKKPAPAPQQPKSKEVEKKSAPLKDSRGRFSKEAPPEELPPKQSTKRKSIPDDKESPRAKRTSLETPKVAKPNGSRQSVPAAKTSPAPAPAAPAPRASACPFCSNRTFDEKKALVKHLRKRHGMDYATVRQRLAIYGGNW